MGDDNSTVILHEEDPCGLVFEADYDQPLHIGALFIVMGCSFLGTMLPVLSKRFPLLRVRDVVLSCAKMLGSGVILATALVHMMVPATQTLTSPCLPTLWTDDYTGFAGAFAMAAILIVHAIQFFASKHLRQSHKRQDLPKEQEIVEAGLTSGDVPMTKDGKRKCDHDGHVHGLLLGRDRQIAAYILELGIASHSIIIGVALGVARDPEFHALIVALSFHQFFEGLALSTVVLESNFERKTATIVMIALYTLTTPTGVAIGIGLNKTFNPNSIDGLITMGVLDALSAGILLYDSLVNIISPHFRSEKFEVASTLEQMLQFTFLWIGAGGMALIGRWA